MYDDVVAINETHASASENSLSIDGLLKPLKLPFGRDMYDHLLSQLEQSIPWQQDSFVSFDRRFTIPRMQAWFADDGLQYRYADNLMHTQPWLPELLQLRQIINNATQCEFNAVLATLYRHGNDHVTWHSDDERELGYAPVIASLSLGATRCFQFRHKENDTKGEISLHHGDLIVMEPAFQHYWEHQVPPQPDVLEPRINLTFRRVYSEATY
ncbi:alpha-ketoglutarate-dependent dioxygenase AlkB family protein [Teredinibacter turnerae]|uniref:Alkylated DNA repair protein n=1 Tax=Teredinibacter turnerae (strain ATCC 39867 / T7901) TaxID=377629 RepID=C5BTC2_TERTT|nr:alpha-ketoglutarate-dependent dioxygenase AlkB [Teredinibacter turnerae]ACR10740.1 putative alkylated DNA repair protein [Teredinibacter turnerae T7901]